MPLVSQLIWSIQRLSLLSKPCCSLFLVSEAEPFFSCECALCGSEFQDIFDIDHFITSLRDEVRILRELPPRLKRRVELGIYYSLPPISWSDISYYVHQVLFYLRTSIYSYFSCF